jgi:hypothetical protein
VDNTFIVPVAGPQSEGCITQMEGAPGVVFGAGVTELLDALVHPFTV